MDTNGLTAKSASRKDTSYRQADPDRLIASALVFKGQTNSWVLRNKLAATNLSST